MCKFELLVHKMKNSRNIIFGFGFIAILFSQTHFSFTENTGNYEPFFIGRLTLRGGPLESNDEIGVFDNELCVGAIEYTGEMWAQMLAWKDDEWTDEQDGFISGNIISFRLWDASLEEEIHVEKIEFLNGDTFDTSGVFNESAWARVHLSALLPQNFVFTETIQYQLIQLDEVSLRNQSLSAESEIGILGNGLIVGAGIYSGESFQKLFVWADDTVSSNQDGFLNGDTLSFKYFDEIGDSLIGPLTVEYSENPDWNSTGFLYIETISGVQLSTNPQIFIEPQVTIEDIDFNPINLSQGVLDPDENPNQILWSFFGNEELEINMENFILTVGISEPNWFGTENIQLIAADSHGGADSLMVLFTVLPVNDQPFVENINIGIFEDSESVIPLSGLDVDGDEITISILSEPGFGTFDPETEIYSPNENYHGTDMFFYNAFDGELYSNDGMVEIIITSVNDIPFVDAGEDITINENVITQLNGTGWDVEGPVSFQWSSDSLIQFQNPNASQTEVIAPNLNISTDFTLTLSVTDSDGIEVSDSLILTVSDLGDIDEINLVPSWNLISFDVTMENSEPESIFSEIIGTDNLVYITGYDSISFYFDPFGPSFFNTLNSIDTGFGYWVKVIEEDEVLQSGLPTPDNYNINLSSGWNLVGYWLDNPIAPENAFSQLISSENLIYVTGFGSGGAVFFEPGGIFNTLEILENGYGYWVKLLNNVENFQYPIPSGFSLKSSQTKPNLEIVKTNIFMFINGTISLPKSECNEQGTVSIFTKTGLLVGEIKVSKSCDLQTAPVYGDDPTTNMIDGALPNQKLQFMYNNQIATSQDIEFNGTMDLKRVHLLYEPNAYKVFYAQSYPNPFNSNTTIQFNFGHYNNNFYFISIYDLNGFLIRSFSIKDKVSGDSSVVWNGLDRSGKSVPSGVYFCRIQKETDMKTLKLVLLN
mgnify:CR=1 FL=1